MKRDTISFCAAGASLLALLAGGCAGTDPRGEFRVLPASPAQPFREPAGAGGGETGPAATAPAAIEGATLDLADCTALALERNPETAASWQALRAAAARAGRAKADLLPRLGFTAEASRGTAADTGGAAVSAARNRFLGVFGVHWLFLDSGGREARVAAAAAEVLAAGFRHNSVLNEVALQVAEAYYGQLGALAFEQQAEENSRQAEIHLDLAEARHRAGVAAGTDVLRAQTARAELELELARARTGVLIARGQLATAMGISVRSRFEIAARHEDGPDDEDAGIEALLAEAARNRPELAEALARVRARRAAVRLAESRFHPALALNAEGGVLDAVFPADRRRWNLGLTLELPLFDGYERLYQLHADEAELSREIAGGRRLLQGVELEVWTAYRRFLEASQAITAARRFTALAGENLRAAEARYKLGAGSMIELVDARTMFSASENRLVTTRLERRLAGARLEYAAGRFPPENDGPGGKGNGLE